MRIDYRTTFTPARDAMVGLERAVNSSPLEPELLELIRLRASQLNACGYCIDMHTKVAEALQVSRQKLYLVSVWKEAPFYSGRERAALAWCDALTLLSQSDVTDDLYQGLSVHFNSEEIVALTLAVVAINGWNRFAIALRSPVGSYIHPAGK